MTHSLGVYWAPGHQRQADIDYMRQLQPPAIRVLDPDVNQIAIAYQTCPNALILPRDWSLSEQHNDVRVDPERTGKRHAQEWRQKIDQWRMARTPLPPDNQIIVVGINEPQVWSMLPQVVTYTVAMLDECTRLGLRASALNLSVGWPANTGEGTPPDWTPYKPIEAAIKHGNHYLTLHSYWYKSGPQDGAGWWAWRHHACPWDVPIIIGEAGVDLYVDMERWANDGKPNRGWRGNISPDQYAAQIEQYARGCDRRVVAILPFLTDYRSNNWESFDTLEAHSALLARKDNMIPQAQPPSQPSTPPATVHIPTVSTGATSPAPVQPTHFVRVPAGAYLRTAPDLETGVVVEAIPYLETVTVNGYDTGSDGKQWARTWHVDGDNVWTGWVRGDLLEVIPEGGTPPTPAPSEQVDKWQRSIEWVLQWEGGYQNVANDKGNWTGCKVGEGENKGTNYGISACSYPDLDIRALTLDEARAIYERDYWQASGASALDYPLCLLVLDTAILHGVGTAKKWLAETGPNPYAFAAKRLRTYTKLDNWDFWGKGWTNRTADLLEEMSA